MIDGARSLGAQSVQRTTDPQDLKFLAKTIELAEKGRCAARPNPVVGAILAQRDGTILATGYHSAHGKAHAERECLDAAPAVIPADATLFVSLEPCDHQGRTAPCSQAIVERGVKRVVYASSDANPITSGSGPYRLVQAGVKVERGSAELEQKALQQNAGFHSQHLRGRPYVTAKYAITRTGHFATGDPNRRWISGEESRALVHYLRAGSGAIACGIGTVLADDPLLTVRGEYESLVTSPPLRVVYDRELRTPLTSKLVATASNAPVLVICRDDAPILREKELTARGVEVLRLTDHKEPGSGCIITNSLGELSRRGVNDLLLEAGPRFLLAAWRAGIIDKLHAIVAPFDVDLRSSTDNSALPAIDIQHPIIARALAESGEKIGVDTQHIALLYPVWEIPGALAG